MRIYAGCTYRNVATMENQHWSHRHATWEVNAFLMLPTGCCRSYNTQSARLHQQLNAFLMSTLPTMVQFVTLPQYPKWWKPDCTSMQLQRKCTRSAHWLHSPTDHRLGPSRFHFWTKLKPSTLSTPPPFIYGPTLSTIKLWECERQVPGNNFIAGRACTTSSTRLSRNRRVPNISNYSHVNVVT